jgi:hypothetical protein
MFQIKVVEKSKHTFYVQKLFSENRAVYGITSKNVVDPDMLQIIRRRVACWIGKATRAQVQVRARAPTHVHGIRHTHAPIRTFHVLLLLYSHLGTVGQSRPT